MIQVKLYGTLSRQYPDYQHAQGLEVEIPNGAKVRDLLDILEIPESQGAVVVMEGRVLKTGDRIGGGFTVSVLQPIHGG